MIQLMTDELSRKSDRCY